ncbi:MAG: hypothetical protein PHQ35_00145 [Phycisphaerae bacterium]|nr:hypothetical protein [Phycisphaerae bacterium]MDD5381638.1 hypothetical protein [Phycisphaerae bacterium]
MKNLYLSFFVICAFITTTCIGDIKLGDNTAVVFATVDEGKKILSTQDDFVQCLSPFDRSARLKTDRDVSKAEFLEFAGHNALPWTDSEKQKVESAFYNLQAKLKILPLPFPKTIYMVKTTGNEEGHASYTRGSAVIIPEDKLAENESAVEKLICHELFHVLTRANPDLRERLYGLIGFTKCNEIEFPAELKSRKITNPDASRNDHYIRLQLNGKVVSVVPILFSIAEKYDVARGGEFFNYLQFQFLLVEQNGGSSDFRPVYDGQNPKLVDMEELSGLIEQVGKNTDYLIHPEEILADNFALLVMQEQNVPSPDVLKKIKEVLTKKQIAEPNAPADANKSSS